MGKDREESLPFGLDDGGSKESGGGCRKCEKADGGRERDGHRPVVLRTREPGIVFAFFFDGIFQVFEVFRGWGTHMGFVVHRVMTVHRVGRGRTIVEDSAVITHELFVHNMAVITGLLKRIPGAAAVLEVCGIQAIMQTPFGG